MKNNNSKLASLRGENREAVTTSKITQLSMDELFSCSGGRHTGECADIATVSISSSLTIKG